MPQPGDIFVVKDFIFEDGSQRDKWFVVLNASNLEKPCIVLKTTSNPKRYQSCVKGCNKDLRCFFTPIIWQTCFKIDTYIQLPQIFEFSAETLLKDKFMGRIVFQPALSVDCFAQLKGCLASYKDDITQAHWDLIYKIKT
jgi:hypothetical protein